MSGKSLEISSFGPEGDRLLRSCRERIEKAGHIRDQIVNVTGKRTKENTLDPLAEIEIHIDAGTNYSELMESVHPDENVRLAAELCHKEMVNFASELELDRSIFEAVSSIKSHDTPQDAEIKRFIDHTCRDFQRAGVDKDSAARQRIKDLKEDLVLLAQAFNRNIRTDTRHILLNSTEDLAGLPEDYVEAHQPLEDGKIKITTDYPDLVPFMNYAKSDAYRKQLHFEYYNRAYPENIEVLDKIIARRHELATLLGFRSWASFSAGDKMIATSKAIAQFIEDIASISKERADRDKSALLKRKQKTDPGAQDVMDWEKAYLQELVRSETMGFDSQEIRPYLEYGRVKEGVLLVTEELFNLTYRKSDEPAWHPSVEVYDVYSGNKRKGRFYLDMHPRPGKYKHAAMFPVISGVKGTNLPEAALVCNFQKPDQSSGPALLEHSDVVTFFHELGHLLHHIIGGSQQYARFSGVATEWDFVEVPSQLLEEWAYRYEILKKFAIHEKTGETVPEEMIARMNKARSFGRGAGVQQQMFYAALSLTYHDRVPDETDSTTILKQLQSRYSPYTHVNGTHLQASFGHLEGYSSLYYTYMWSQVIARDLFNQFAKKELLNQDLASRYCRTILEPGGSRDAADLIRSFLGRDYNFDAYKRWLEEGE